MLDLITSYADTWRLLLEYDEDRLPPPPPPATPTFNHDNAVAMIDTFKNDLAKRGEASLLFGKPYGDGLEAILGNIE